jgi:hypothetical protein
MKTRSTLMTLAALALLAAGCVHVRPQATSIDYDSDSMEIVGRATGEASRANALFGLIPVSSPASVAVAVDRAVKSVNADALINTVVDDECGTVLGFFNWQTIRVHGTAVKFKFRPAEPAGPEVKPEAK